MHTVTIAGTSSALNQYCNKFSKRIHQTLKQSLEFEQELPFVSCDYAYTAENASVSDVLQPYQWQFTPNNSESFDAVTSILQNGKIDMIFTAEQLAKFFDKWRCNWFELGKSAKEWSYPRFMLQEFILPKFIEELNMASYSGVRVDPTPGTAGAFLEAFDGFGTNIANAITAGSVTPIATGVLADATMVTQVRDFCKGLPVLYRYKPGILRMSTTNAQRYADNYQTLYPNRKVTEEKHDMQYLRVDHMNKLIKPMVCMEGSNRIICEFPDLKNMIIGTRTGQPVYPKFRFQEFDRTLKVYAELSRFYGHEYWGHVFVNDQA